MRSNAATVPRTNSPPPNYRLVGPTQATDLDSNALGRLAPIEYETIMTTPTAQAASPNLSPEHAAASFARMYSLPARA